MTRVQKRVSKFVNFKVQKPELFDLTDDVSVPGMPVALLLIPEKFKKYVIPKSQYQAIMHVLSPTSWTRSTNNMAMTESILQEFSINYMTRRHYSLQNLTSPGDFHF